MPSTPINALRYPLDTDLVADTAQRLQELAEDVERELQERARVDSFAALRPVSAVNTAQYQTLSNAYVVGQGPDVDFVVPASLKVTIEVAAELRTQFGSHVSMSWEVVDPSAGLGVIVAASDDWSAAGVVGSNAATGSRGETSTRRRLHTFAAGQAGRTLRARAVYRNQYTEFSSEEGQGYFVRREITVTPHA